MHNTKKVLFTILSFFILFNFTNAAVVEDGEKTIQNNTIHRGDKIKAEGISGDWIVTDVTEDKTCNITRPPEPAIHAVHNNYEPSFGFTYENTCLKLGTKTQYWCASSCVGGGHADATDLNSINTKKIFSNSNDSDLNKIFNEVSEPKLIKIVEFDGPGKDFGGGDSNTSSEVTDNTGSGPTGATGDIGSGGSGTRRVRCTGFVDTYDRITVGWTYYTYPCTSWCDGVDPFTGAPTTYCCEYTCTPKTNKQNKSRLHEDCIKSTCGEFADEYDGERPESAGPCPAAHLAAPICGGEVKKVSGSTTVTYCAETGPTKVEAFTYKLVVHTTDGKAKEAYCMNPAYDFNSTYAWDTTFDPSKCADSLHSHDKNGNLVFDMECGYVYILSEAKRINAEQGKEVFSYSSIVTAMRLFGTGITTKDKSLPVISDMTSHLQASGYYSNTYGFGYGEYIGIPGIIPPKSPSWPAIYRYWMPKTYSIYINTANVVESYLKNNIRFSDVGNKPCTAGTALCSIYPDGKSYSVDARNYFNYKECKETFKNCNSSAFDIIFSSVDDLGAFPDAEAIYPDKTAENGNRNDPNSTSDPSENALTEFISDGNGQKSNCKDESGLGVLCGLEHEAIQGATINNSGVPTNSGKIGDSDYLDAIYLYIRALQGNKIEYETKIQEAIDKYKPIEGLTKIIYNAEGKESGYMIRYTIDTQTMYENTTVDCKDGDPDCEASIFIYDASNNLIQKNDSYDYCQKNYCYVEIKKTKICTNEKNSRTLKSVVVSNPDLKHTFIKKIGNGGRKEQILYVYDDTGSVSGGFCEEIIAVQDDLSVNCPCDPKEKSNTVIPDGNIKDVNYCKDNYNAFDELYYGDPSMSTIINACYDEDQIKYDFTEDLNANGNDLVHEGEQPVSKYSYQIKSDDFDVCTLYCRDESRLYLANKISVRAGMHLQYDIGGALLDKKLINETVNQRDKQSYKYMPSVVLQYRECTSIFDSEKWKKLYNSASSTREKNQLIYSAYNCNLYTTDEIVAAINKGDIPDVLGLKNKEYVNKTGSEFKDKNSLNNNYAEPAMIEYAYSMDTGKVTVIKDWGTTKDYLIVQEACTSMGKASGTDCASYDITDYSDSYYDSLGILMNYEHGLVKSNLSDTIYCSGEKCYKLLGSDGKYYYNTKDSIGRYDYTTVDAAYDEMGNLVHAESGKILSYNDWALKSKEHDKNSSEFKSQNVGGYKIPTNEYSSFIVVTETGFYNDKSYYTNSYTGEITTESTSKNTILDPNIYPLHLNKDTGEYPITANFTKVRTAYKRSEYYKEKNYSLNEDIKYNTNALPSTFQYVCYYDVYKTQPGDHPENNGAVGYTYRMVDLEDVFASVSEGESSSDRTREYPENWSTTLGQSTLNEVENSAAKILEPEGDGDTEYSYLEYSYTLTKQGIIKLRRYNDSQKSNGGYLNDTVVDCEYDAEEGIFYNCNSTFLQDIARNTSEYSGEGLITVNKDNGASEFCSSMHNADEDYCKYQKKSILTAGGNN